ncbi:hypothetical protein Tco_1093430, partial [Tanacetum coccineum]
VHYRPIPTAVFGRGAESGEENDYGAMNPPSSSHSAAMYESMNIQTVKDELDESFAPPMAKKISKKHDNFNNVSLKVPCTKRFKSLILQPKLPQIRPQLHVFLNFRITESSSDQPLSIFFKLLGTPKLAPILVNKKISFGRILVVWPNGGGGSGEWHWWMAVVGDGGGEGGGG